MFKPGDFLRNKNGVIDYDCYINSDNGIEYACTYIYDNRVGFHSHIYAHSNYNIHPTLGIHFNDQIDIGSTLFTGINLINGIFHLVNLNCKYICNEKSLLTYKNITKPHWNTCAQHRLKLMSQTSNIQVNQNTNITTQPVITTGYVFQINDKIEEINKSTSYRTMGTVSSIDYITNEYEVSWGVTVTKEKKAFIENNYRLYTPSQNNLVGTITVNPFYTGSFPNLPKGASVDSFSGNESCNHEWKVYTGFNEFYNFCSLCDLKQTKE